MDELCDPEDSLVIFITVADSRLDSLLYTVIQQADQRLLKLFPVPADEGFMHRGEGFLDVSAVGELSGHAICPLLHELPCPLPTQTVMIAPKLYCANCMSYQQRFHIFGRTLRRISAQHQYQLHPTVKRH